MYQIATFGGNDEKSAFSKIEFKRSEQYKTPMPLRLRATLLLLLLVPTILFGSEPIRIVTWNLQWFPGREQKAGERARRMHMVKAQEALLKLDPDVICLQEVRDWKAVEELLSVIPEIRIAIVSSFSGGQQQAIASKLVSDSAWWSSWKMSSRSDPTRGYAFAALECGERGILLVYSLHLKANGTGTYASDMAKRVEASTQLLQHVSEMEELYRSRGNTAVVLAGDFNTTLEPDLRFRDETTLRQLLQHGFWWTGTTVPFSERITNQGSGKFAPADFDHIFTKGLGSPNCRVQNTERVSDHQPVITEINDTALPR